MTAIATPVRGLLVTLAALAAGTAPLVAQVHRTDTPEAEEGLTVPRFPIRDSPIGLRSAVRPGAYLGVTGPRSAWLGLETGEAEVWVHPLKVLRNLELSFRTPLYRDPIPGRTVARTVEVRPELTTITYSHAYFTVRQHVLAPADEPGIVVLLETDAIGPMDVVVEFQPVLQYMWPGAFGGQYVFWDEANHLFVLSESLQRRNAVIGSPRSREGTTHPAHRLSEEPSVFAIPVDTARAAGALVPIVVAGGTVPRDSVFAAYRRMIRNAPALYEEKRAWADSVLTTTTSIDTPDDSLDLALEWAKINLEEQRVCNPELGCGFVAGWGISGTSSRPGFGWYFGGDAAITSLAMDVTGQWALVAEDLRFLARYQRADGKIPHEISQAAAFFDWFEDYPYPYYHADTTPYWMLALHRYWRASGDDATVRELWDDYLEAYAWCLTAETDGDGIIENTAGGYGAIEVGELGEALHQDVYLAGVWIEALEATVALARSMGDGALAAEADSIRALAMETLEARYWREEEGHHAFGILVGGATNDNLTAWPATAASFGLLRPDRADRTLRKLASDSISSEWGARLLSTGSDLYDPLHYNNGAVWPFVTGFVAWGQYVYRRPWAGFHLIDAVKQTTFDWARGRHPENLSGAYYRTLDATVPHQFFATSMLVTPLLRGLVGWEPDAPAGRATLAPRLPPAWGDVTVRRLRVGATEVHADLGRWADGAGAVLQSRGPGVDVEYVESVPLGARTVRVAVGDGPARAAEVDWGLHDGTVTETLSLAEGRGRARILLSWEGGLQVAAPRFELRAGQRSGGVRVVDFRHDGDAWLLTVEGEPGAVHEVTVYGERVISEGVERVRSDLAGGWILPIRMPAGAGRQVRTVRLTPAG